MSLVTGQRVNGEMICLLGPRPLQLLRGEQPPLQVMMENRLLYKYYANAFRFGRAFAQFQSLMRAVAHKNPCTRVLEIGASTVGATRYAMQTLGSQEEGGPFIDSWHSTDTSSLLSRGAGDMQKTGPFIACLRDAGCRVVAISCDVSSNDDLARDLRTCEVQEQLPAIRGIVQGAMVLQDSILKQMTLDDWQTAIGPKVTASWNLQSHFSQRDTLDFFVKCSRRSRASSVGPAKRTTPQAGPTRTPWRAGDVPRACRRSRSTWVWSRVSAMWPRISPCWIESVNLASR